MNKRNKIILLLLIILAILCGVYYAMKYKNPAVESEIPEIESVINEQENINENESDMAEKQDKKETTNKITPVKKVNKKVNKPLPVNKTVDKDAEQTTVECSTIVEDVAKDNGPEKVVVIDKEYKCKSPSKYFFKSRF